MLKTKIYIGSIPAIIWGNKSNRAYLFVHGKMANKESAENFAAIADSRGYQTISFDLPEHGERKNIEYKCDIINGIADLTQVREYIFANWENVSLYGCSLGAFFSLHAYKDINFDNCMFLSPIVDMKYLIQQMFVWFNITEDELKEKGEIDTPIDTMSWSYYQYVKEYSIEKWISPTHILYGGKDNLQSYDIIKAFGVEFDCLITVSENSEHPFMDENDKEIVDNWIRNIL